MDHDDDVMINLVWRGGTPDLASVAKRFGVPQDAFDPTFGIILVSPDEYVYTVRVGRSWGQKITRTPGTEGPFPEGKISTFGPESDE